MTYLWTISMGFGNDPDGLEIPVTQEHVDAARLQKPDANEESIHQLANDLAVQDYYEGDR